MKYRHDRYNRQFIRHKSMLLVPLGFAVLGGLYLLTLLGSPRLSPVSVMSSVKAIENPQQIPFGENQIIIPKIGVNIEYLTGDAKTLEKAAWQRFPERGNPEIGGNFIVSAHRFRLGWTPEKTRQRSPFYNLHRLNAGDLIYVDFKGTRYTYEVKRRYKVEPDEISIEAPSDEAKLTLYSCTLKGAQDGREVIEAKLLTI